MAEITIKDTGFGKREGSSTDFTTKANSGTALTLKGVSIDYQIKANVGDKKGPNQYNNTETTLGAVDNPTITLTGVMVRGSSGDLSTVTKLVDMTKTKGLKVLYYDYATVGCEYNMVIQAVAQYTGATSGTTINAQVGSALKFLIVRPTSFQIKQSADNRISQWTLTMMETE